MEVHNLTNIDKEFISIPYLMEISGLGQSTCTRIMKEVKLVSDVIGVSGWCTYADWLNYIEYRTKKGDDDSMKKLLNKYGYTREEFAKMVGVPVATVHYWCDNSYPSPKDLKRIARGLGISVAEVVEYLG